MRKFFYLISWLITLNILLVTPSHAVPGGIFKSIFNLFKSGGDDVIKSADDVLRGTKNQGENVINTSDDLLRDIKNKQIGNTSAQADEAIVLERIGADNHIVEFKTLKKSSRTDYIQHLRRHGDELIDNDLFDVYENITSDNSKYPTSFKTYVLLNWIGRIYIKSNYFNKPKFEDKTMLVCKNIDQVFYLSLLMEQEPKRAFLTKNLKFKKNTKNISSQELFIIEDTEKRKIMVTWPVNTEFPQNYFVIYPNQNFYYENPSSGTLSPEQFKKYLSKRKSFKNKCFKATESGLL
tara:strand:- start:5 stop:883 length:879 start_codon:yes stop_codon:yes gene_type:complete